MADNYLTQYFNAIVRGEIIVGLEIYTEVKKLVEDLENPKYIYDTTDAYVRIDFIENCVRLTKEPFYGKLMKLQLFQKAWIEAFYSFKFADSGLDRFTETLLLIARKNGKSELCSALLITELILGGEGLDIVCGSNDETQASILYDACDKMRLMIDPNEVDTWKNQKGITCLFNQNKIYKLTERKRNKEGYNISIAVIDEVHEMKNNSLYKPIEQSTGTKLKYKIIIITTEGFVNNGFLDGLLKEYRDILEDNDLSYKAERRLPWLYTQDSEKEIWETDENGVSKLWQKANPSLGVIKTFSYLRDQVDGARKNKSDRAYVLSKDFNFKVSNSHAWLDYNDFNYDYEMPEIDSSFIAVGGVDLSEVRDMTSAKILLVRKDDNKKYILSHYWIPESKLKYDDKEAGAKYEEWAQQGLLTICPDNQIDLSLVADWFYNMQQKHKIYIYKIGYDRKFKETWVNRMEYYGWRDKEELVEILQSPDRLTDHIYQVEADLKYRKIIGLNEIDKWCLGNCSLKINNEQKVLLTKMNNKPAYRKDGADSLVICEATYDLFRTDISGML